MKEFQAEHEQRTVDEKEKQSKSNSSTRETTRKSLEKVDDRLEEKTSISQSQSVPNSIDRRVNVDGRKSSNKTFRLNCDAHKVVFLRCSSEVDRRIFPLRFHERPSTRRRRKTSAKPSVKLTNVFIIRNKCSRNKCRSFCRSTCFSTRRTKLNEMCLNDLSGSTDGYRSIALSFVVDERAPTERID